MKRISLIFLIFSLALTFSAADDVDTYAAIYRMMNTNVEQLGILRMMVNEKVPGAGDFYVAALRRLLSEFPNLTGAGQIGTANAQALLLAEVLGDEKRADAASDLWQLTEIFNRDSRLQSTVMLSLGKMQEPYHLSHIIKVLERMNDAPVRSDMLNNEIVANSAIIALEYYGDARGYIPIYFASIGWYSGWVKNQALQSMQKIAANSAPFMEEMIRNPVYNHEAKLAALNAIESSDLPTAKKAEIAVMALSATWTMPSNEKGHRTMVRQSRKLALTMFGKYGIPDNSAYTLIDHCYVHTLDIAEKHDVIVTLVKLASDDSVRLLTNHLIEMNVKRISNAITNEDLVLTRLLIEALGEIRNPTAVPILNVTAAMDWTDAIKNVARAARRKIEGQ